MPGDVELLSKLPAEHPANVYLDIRGYNVPELAERHKLMYCTLAAPKYSLAQNRIIVPIYQNQMFVGWQARYVGDIDWKSAGVPKYYTLPQMPKRIILYSHDVAFAQSMVVVTEGPTSCWAVWPYGVAILGKQATIQQQRMLHSKAADKPIVLLLDGDAKYESAKLHRALKNRVRAGIVNITLPEDRDPGSYHNQQDELWELIYQQAKEQKVSLPERDKA